LTCKLCKRFWNWHWKNSDAWEWAHSNESDLRSAESKEARELIERAFAIEETDPDAAFHLCGEAAEAGSAWAMGRVGWHYETGTAVAVDLYKALQYYHRAICAGSWMSTIFYARLLAKAGQHDEAERVLQDGIASDFVPAYFWLGRLRYDRSKTRMVCGEVRPLLQYAAEKGHPGARLTLARWMLLGKFGLPDILTGLKLSFRLAREFSKRADAANPNPRSPSRAAPPAA
jgi:TPR repeat protein